jgi:hypothetical protein
LFKTDLVAKSKIELIFTGTRYLKILIIPLILLLDVYSFAIHTGIYSIPFLASLSIQAFCAVSLVGLNIMTIRVMGRNKYRGPSFLLSKMLLDVCVMPALITGSVLGLLRKKGTFYRTKRTRYTPQAKQSTTDCK